jgi:hypothetical protein
VRKLRGAVSPEARVIIETRPGEECQVDYGTGPMVRDPDSGKYRRTRLFVMTLGYSRKSVRLLVFRSSSRVWAELHEKAFRRLGGTPRIVVLDIRHERSPDNRETPHSQRRKNRVVRRDVELGKFSANDAGVNMDDRAFRFVDRHEAAGQPNQSKRRWPMVLRVHSGFTIAFGG